MCKYISRNVFWIKVTETKDKVKKSKKKVEVKEEVSDGEVVEVGSGAREVAEAEAVGVADDSIDVLNTGFW